MSRPTRRGRSETLGRVARTLLALWWPGHQTVLRDLEAAKAEAAAHGVTESEINAVLYPPGEDSPLRAFYRIAELAPIARLAGQLDTMIGAATKSGLSDEDITPLKLALDTYEVRRTEYQQLVRRYGVGERRVTVPANYHDLTLRQSLEYPLRKAGVISDRAVALYSVLARKIPAQRQRHRRAHVPTFNTAALALTARLVSGTYFFEGVGPITSAQLKARIQKQRTR